LTNDKEAKKIQFDLDVHSSYEDIKHHEKFGKALRE